MMEKMNVMQIRKSSQSTSVCPSISFNNALNDSPLFFDILLFFRGVDFFLVNVVQAQPLKYTHFLFLTKTDTEYVYIYIYTSDYH